MGNKKNQKYIIKNLILQLALVFIPALLMILVMYILKVSVSKLKISFIELSEVPNNILYIIIYFVSTTMFYGITRKYNQERILFDGDIYAECNFIWYKVALFLGYKQVSLIRKPYRKIYKILNSGKFYVLDSGDEKYENAKYVTERLNNNSEEVSLILEDTYPIDNKSLPNKIKNDSFVRFKRVKPDVGKRIESKEFIDDVGKEIRDLKENGKTINLFATLSSSNLKYLIEQYIMLGNRHNLNFIIYQYDSKSKKFIEEGFVIKEGD